MVYINGTPCAIGAGTGAFLLNSLLTSARLVIFEYDTASLEIFSKAAPSLFNCFVLMPLDFREVSTALANSSSSVMPCCFGFY